MALTVEEKQSLHRYAHANMKMEEESKMIVTYLMLKRMTSVCLDDAKTLDVLQSAAPLFALTKVGSRKMAQLFIRWEQLNPNPQTLKIAQTCAKPS